MKKQILIVTDAYKPQVNGVVTTLVNVEKQLVYKGHDVRILCLDDCERTIRLPFYKEVGLGWIRKDVIEEAVQGSHAIHISTPEGPIGFRVLRYCVKNNIPFTTGYHTKWPEFIKARAPIPLWLTYKYMRWLHKHSKAILVPTQTAVNELTAQGFNNLVVWTRGVDRDLFKPNQKEYNIIPKLVCVSRVSHEKGLDDFCSLDGVFTKTLVGDGPYLKTLKKKYTDVEFLGMLHGEELADVYANADVFVFPSKTDTFGVVMLEAMACGTPVAAYPVTGPIDVIDQGVTGVMDDSLYEAMASAIELNRLSVYENSKKWTWEECSQQFYNSLHFINK